MERNDFMRCKDCNNCSQRGSYQYFFCDVDNEVISADDYYNGTRLDCPMSNRLDEDDTLDTWMTWMIARK